MIEFKTKIANKSGLHSKSATNFINFVSRYKCTIEIIKDNSSINAKSILSILILDLGLDDEIVFRISGENEQQVADEILDYMQKMKG